MKIGTTFDPEISEQDIMIIKPCQKIPDRETHFLGAGPCLTDIPQSKQHNWSTH